MFHMEERTTVRTHTYKATSTFIYVPGTRCHLTESTPKIEKLVSFTDGGHVPSTKFKKSMAELPQLSLRLLHRYCTSNINSGTIT